MMVTPQSGDAACVWRLRFLNATLLTTSHPHCHGRLRLIVERAALHYHAVCRLPWKYSRGLQGAHGLERMGPGRQV